MVVVGLGVGGEEVAERLAEAGLTVVGIERDLVGGECPYWGCVPSKMMIRAATRSPRRAGSTGWPGRRRSSRTGRRWPSGSARRPPTPGTTRCGGPVHRQGRPVRPGQRPARRPGPGHASATRCSRPGTGWCSAPAPGRRPADRRPGRHAVLDQPPGDRGRGAAGVAAGARRRRDRPGVGPGLRPVRRPGHGGRGAATGCSPSRSRRRPRWPPRRCAPTAWRSTPAYGPSGSSHDGGRFTVHARRRREFTAEQLLVVTGRKAHLEELGLDTIGLDAGQRYLPVDDRMHVTDGVWAVGDVTGEGAFTHIAMYQAAIVVADMLDHVRQCGAGPDASGTASVVGGAVGAASSLGGAMRVERVGRHRAPRRLPGAAPGDLHRSRGRRGRAHRAAGPRAGHQRAGRVSPSWPSRPGAGSTGRQRRASSSSSPTPTRAC